MTTRTLKRMRTFQLGVAWFLLLEGAAMCVFGFWLGPLILVVGAMQFGGASIISRRIRRDEKGTP